MRARILTSLLLPFLTGMHTLPLPRDGCTTEVHNLTQFTRLMVSPLAFNVLFKVRDTSTTYLLRLLATKEEAKLSSHISLVLPK